MKRVATAVVLIPLVLLAVYRAPFWLFVLLVGVVALLATHEYLNIIKTFVDPIGSGPYAGISLLFASAVVLATYYEIPILLSLTVGLVTTFAFAMRRTDLREASLAVALSFLAVPYIGVTLLCVASFQPTTPRGFFLVLLFLAVWIGDTAAYYVGRSIGRHKLAPTLSPKKTWEGAIASALFSALAVGIWARYSVSTAQVADLPADIVPKSFYLLHSSFTAAFVCGLIINIAAQLGDLFESMIKRGAGVKDSGTILPGHGGILDRIDALLFAAPVALLLFTILDRFVPAR